MRVAFSTSEDEVLDLPRKKFNQDQANKLWSNYTKNLIESITQTEKEGLEKGMSSYEIERLWQQKTKEKFETLDSHETNDASSDS